MTIEELFQAFKTEAFDAEIDPEEEYYWDSLAFGFAIAKGVGRAMAFHLQLYWYDYASGVKTIEDIVAEYDPHIFDEEN